MKKPFDFLSNGYSEETCWSQWPDLRTAIIERYIKIEETFEFNSHSTACSFVGKLQANGILPLEGRPTFLRTLSRRDSLWAERLPRWKKNCDFAGLLLDFRIRYSRLISRMLQKDVMQSCLKINTSIGSNASRELLNFTLGFILDPFQQDLSIGFGDSIRDNHKMRDFGLASFKHGARFRKASNPNPKNPSTHI